MSCTHKYYNSPMAVLSGMMRCKVEVRGEVYFVDTWQQKESILFEVERLRLSHRRGYHVMRVFRQESHQAQNIDCQLMPSSCWFLESSTDQLMAPMKLVFCLGLIWYPPVQWQHSKCLLIIFLYFILGEMKCTLESRTGAILTILTDSF